MWGISRGFVLIQDGGDRSRKDFWHIGEWTQVFTGICEIHFIVIQINASINIGQIHDSLFRCSIKTTFLNVADITYGML